MKTYPQPERPAVAGLIEREITLSSFARVPLALAQNVALSGYDFQIYTALCLFADFKTGLAWPSRKALAAALGLPPEYSQWPSTFYHRLAKAPQFVNGRGRRVKGIPEGITVYQIVTDSHFALLPNVAPQWPLTPIGYRGLIAIGYVCLPDAAAALANAPDQPIIIGPEDVSAITIGPEHVARIIQHAGFDGSKYQRRRYLNMALQQYHAHGWLSECDEGLLLTLPESIDVLRLHKTATRLHKTAGKLHKTATKLHKTATVTDIAFL